MVDSSCFLVSARPSFYPVFGRLWTQIGPKFSRRSMKAVSRYSWPGAARRLSSEVWIPHVAHDDQ